MPLSSLVWLLQNWKHFPLPAEVQSPSTRYERNSKAESQFRASQSSQKQSGRDSSESLCVHGCLIFLSRLPWKCFAFDCHFSFNVVYSQFLSKCILILNDQNNVVANSSFPGQKVYCSYHCVIINEICLHLGFHFTVQQRQLKSVYGAQLLPPLLTKLET